MFGVNCAWTINYDDFDSAKWKGRANGFNHDMSYAYLIYCNNLRVAIILSRKLLFLRKLMIGLSKANPF